MFRSKPRICCHRPDSDSDGADPEPRIAATSPKCVCTVSRFFQVGATSRDSTCRRRSTEVSSGSAKGHQSLVNHLPAQLSGVDVVARGGDRGCQHLNPFVPLGSLYVQLSQPAAQLRKINLIPASCLARPAGATARSLGVVDGLGSGLPCLLSLCGVQSACQTAHNCMVDLHSLGAVPPSFISVAPSACFTLFFSNRRPDYDV